MAMKEYRIKLAKGRDMWARIQEGPNTDLQLSSHRQCYLLPATV
jgi:hypothetical protein